MGQVVVVGGLEGEALAAQVHLEEGLRAGVELAVARPLRIAGLDGLLGVARGGAGRDEAAVEDHRGAGDVLHRTRPQRRLDAVARVVLVVAQRGHRRGGDGGQRREHGRVRGVPARGQQHALLGVDLRVAVVGLEDGAGYLAGILGDQLYQLMVVGDLVAVVVHDLLEQLVAHGDAVAAALGVAVVVLAAGGVEGGGAHAARHLELVGDDHGAGFAHELVDVLEHVVALVHPHVDEVVVARAAGIASPLAVQAGAVGVVALVGEGLGVDGVEPVARGAHLGALLA